MCVQLYTAYSCGHTGNTPINVETCSAHRRHVRRFGALPTHARHDCGVGPATATYEDAGRPCAPCHYYANRNQWRAERTPGTSAWHQCGLEQGRMPAADRDSLADMLRGPPRRQATFTWTPPSRSSRTARRASTANARPRTAPAPPRRRRGRSRSPSRRPGGRAGESVLDHRERGRSDSPAPGFFRALFGRRRR